MQIVGSTIRSLWANPTAKGFAFLAWVALVALLPAGGELRVIWYGVLSMGDYVDRHGLFFAAWEFIGLLVYSVYRNNELARTGFLALVPIAALIAAIEWGWGKGGGYTDIYAELSRGVSSYLLGVAVATIASAWGCFDRKP